MRRANIPSVSRAAPGKRVRLVSFPQLHQAGPIKQKKEHEVNSIGSVCIDSPSNRDAESLEQEEGCNHAGPRWESQPNAHRKAEKKAVKWGGGGSPGWGEWEGQNYSDTESTVIKDLRG
mmetsp:Transcript_56319/g.100321  ORF Transcript_56319/g.100321 Transcript_56319/m.100321 type:complete len:119 (+) Transcript_56319:198-554(+)